MNKYPPDHKVWKDLDQMLEAWYASGETYPGLSKDGGVFNSDLLIEKVIQLQERLEKVEAELKALQEKRTDSVIEKS